VTSSRRSSLHAPALALTAALFITAVVALGTFRSGPVREWLRERIARKQRINETGNPERALSFGGRTRTYLLHLPKGDDGKTPLPLVVVFHGGGGNALSAVRMTGMDATADAQRFIVVYPNGTGPTEGTTSIKSASSPPAFRTAAS
jgi:poly(3-hydroxybutyrate) depolymerase